MHLIIFVMFLYFTYPLKCFQTVKQNRCCIIIIKWTGQAAVSSRIIKWTGQGQAAVSSVLFSYIYNLSIVLFACNSFFALFLLVLEKLDSLFGVCSKHSSWVWVKLTGDKLKIWVLAHPYSECYQIECDRKRVKLLSTVKRNATCKCPVRTVCWCNMVNQCCLFCSQLLALRERSGRLRRQHRVRAGTLTSGTQRRHNPHSSSVSQHYFNS